MTVNTAQVLNPAHNVMLCLKMLQHVDDSWLKFTPPDDTPTGIISIPTSEGYEIACQPVFMM